jgi:hypothetical protein
LKFPTCVGQELIVLACATVLDDALSITRNDGGMTDISSEPSRVPGAAHNHAPLVIALLKPTI